MKFNQFFYLFSLAIACIAANLHASHFKVITPFEMAVNRFEVLSQNAHQQNKKVPDLPVAIRKDIDTFMKELGRPWQEKDLDALQNQLKQYEKQLETTISRQLDTKWEHSISTLRQLLQKNYAKTTNPAHQFTQDLIEYYINKRASLSDRFESAPVDIQESTELFKINKNVLLMSLFDYKSMDIKSDFRLGAISSDGSFLQIGDHQIYERQGDQYHQLQDFQKTIDAHSRDFSVIITTAEISPEEPLDVYIYILNRETKKWVLSQTIEGQQSDMTPRLSDDGSTLVFTHLDKVYSYARQGDHWIALQPLTTSDPISSSSLSPHGLTLILYGDAKGVIYQRQREHWVQLKYLPEGSYHFDINDSLMLIQRGEKATVYARDGETWQEKQSFEGKARIFGNGMFIIINNQHIYAQESQYHWQKQQELYPTSPVYTIDSVYTNDDGTILMQLQYYDCTKEEIDDHSQRRPNHIIFFTLYENSWKQIPFFLHTSFNNLSDSFVSSDGLTLNAGLGRIYAIPAAALEAAKTLHAGQWVFINNLYNAQMQGRVILNREQLELFGTLPTIFQKAILSKWRVSKGTEKGVQYYQERQALKEKLSPEEMAAYTDLKNRELKEYAQKLQASSPAAATTPSANSQIERKAQAAINLS